MNVEFTHYTTVRAFDNLFYATGMGGARVYLHFMNLLISTYMWGT